MDQIIKRAGGTALILMLMFHLTQLPAGTVSPPNVQKWKQSALHAPVPDIPPRTFQSLVINPVRVSEGTGRNVVFVVESTLFEEIEQDIIQYVEDLEKENWACSITEWGGGTPQDLRSYLYETYLGGMSGAVFIGELPVAYCSLEINFGNDTFPTDLYFMDLDGYWPDDDDDGAFEAPTVDVYPEIWIGRLKAEPLTPAGHSEAELVRQYLVKGSRYRKENTEAGGAAVFADPGFWSDSYQGADAVAYLSDNVLRTVDGTPFNYISELRWPRTWMSVYAHGSPEAHYFEEGPVLATDLPGIGINTRFFTSFSCSNSRYTAPNYMGGWYIFSDIEPLGLWGSTKTGSMYYLQDLTIPLSRGYCLGEAYLEWSRKHSCQNPPWFYGVTLLGDATLPIAREPMIRDVTVLDPEGDDDGLPEPGETIQIWIELVNNSTLDLAGALDAELVSKSSDVTILDPSTCSFGSIPSGQAAGSGPYTVILADYLQDGDIPDLELIMSWEDMTWTRPVRIDVAAPVLSMGFPYIANGLDGIIQPGDSADLYLNIINRGSGDLDNAGLVIRSTSPHITLDEEIFDPVSISPGENLWLGPLSIQLDTGCPALEWLDIEMEWEGGNQTDHAGLPVYGIQLTNPLLGWSGLGHDTGTPHTFDQWHLDQDTYHCGQSVEIPYYSGLDAVLEIPMFDTADAAFIEFDHLMLGENTGETAFDGGLVEIDTGNGWIPLYPESGYPATFMVGTTIEFETPCWCSIPAWKTDRVNLPVSTPNQKVRFRFISDGGLGGTGWWIRNLKLVNIVPSAPPGLAPAVHVDMPLSVHPADSFWVNGTITNFGNTLHDHLLFFVLDIYGELWFWPNWTYFNSYSAQGDIDYEQRDIPAGTTEIVVIEPVTWPDTGTQSMWGLFFYGALINSRMTDVVGEMAIIHWGFGP
jgi:hypothetical protein